MPVLPPCPPKGNERLAQEPRTGSVTSGRFLSPAEASSREPSCGASNHSFHCSALHFPALPAVSLYSSSLTSHPSLSLHLHILVHTFSLHLVWVSGGALHPRQAPASRWAWQSLIPSIQPQQHLLRATVLQGSKGPPGCGCDLLAVICCVSPLGCLEVPRAGETPPFDSSQHPAWKPSCLLLHVIPGSRPCSIFSFSGGLDSSGFRENNPQNLGSFPGQQRSCTRSLL